MSKDHHSAWAYKRDEWIHDKLVKLGLGGSDAQYKEALGEARRTWAIEQMKDPDLGEDSEWAAEKARAISRLDKKTMENPIAPYVGWINGLEGVYTTQSCAGHDDADAHLWLRLTPTMAESMRVMAAFLVDETEGIYSIAEVWGREVFPVWVIHMASHTQDNVAFIRACEQLALTLEGWHKPGEGRPCGPHPGGG
jgi:hypothetical protein